MTIAKLDNPATLPAPVDLPRLRWQPRTFMQRVEAFITRLSTRNNFWQRVCSMIWLPYAFHSGIRMKQLDANRFRAVLPFRRFNRNWYNAMAGAALLGNSEIAGGMYLLARCGRDYMIVCKEMRYRFLRPCFGPALYEITDMENLDEKVAGADEFNIRLDVDIRQRLRKRGRDLRVGRCDITFHCTPKAKLHGATGRRKRA